jgi:hypothetical protein
MSATLADSGTASSGWVAVIKSRACNWSSALRTSPRCRPSTAASCATTPSSTSPSASSHESVVRPRQAPSSTSPSAATRPRNRARCNPVSRSPRNPVTAAFSAHPPSKGMPGMAFSTPRPIFIHPAMVSRAASPAPRPVDASIRPAPQSMAAPRARFTTTPASAARNSRPGSTGRARNGCAAPNGYRWMGCRPSPATTVCASSCTMVLSR